MRVTRNSPERSIRGLRGANKGAHKFALCLWRNRVPIDALPGQEDSSVLDVVNTGRFNVDVVKARFGEPGDVLIIVKRPAMQPTHSSMF
jgi:hypothetical protein